MSAAERVSELLDSRGIEYRRYGGVTRGCMEPYTRYVVDSDDDHPMAIIEATSIDDVVLTLRCSAEQAVSAAFSARTCHAVGMDCFGNPPYNKSGLNANSTTVGCSECGAPWGRCGLFRGTKLSHNFKACPLCGRRVVE